MAKKSKTQRAKASALRQAKKLDREQEDLSEVNESAESEAEKESSKKGLFRHSDKESKQAKPSESEETKKAIKKSDEKSKKKRFQFFRDVKAELKRVTWPTRIDVMRWTGVVVAALVFFGVFVAVLDNLVITPLLVLISGADPSTIDWMSIFTGADAVPSGAEGSDASSAADVSSSDASSADASSDATDTSTDVSAEAESTPEE